MTLTQVADHTMIRRTLIENIEADDYHACGGDFYARMHIKSIAHAVGIEDAGPLLAEFDAEHAPSTVPTASGVLDTSSDAGIRADRRRPNWTVAMAVALAAVVAFGGFQLLTGGGDSGTSTDATLAGGTQTTASHSQPSERATGEASETSGSATSGSSSEPTSAPSDAVAVVPAGGVTVELDTVDGKTWVSATGKDSGVIYQNVLGSGRSKTFKDDRQVKLVVGNAGAVHLVVNGRDLGSPGGVGEVVRLTFGPGDPTLAGG